MGFLIRIAEILQSMVGFVSFNRSLTQEVTCGSFNIVSLFLNTKHQIRAVGPCCLAMDLVAYLDGLLLSDRLGWIRHWEPGMGRRLRLSDRL
jgi:hypothetical protein